MQLKILLLCVAAALAGTSLTSPAAEDQKTKQTAALSQPVYDALKEAQELIESKQYSGGLAILEKLRSKGKRSAYETAQIWNLTAYAHYLQEKYPAAIKAYAEVLAQPELPEALVQSTLKTLAQLYFTVEDYKQALATVDRLMAALADPSPDIYMLKGQAHFQLGEFKQALGPIKTALKKYRAAGKQPRENWLLLLRVCYYELKDFENMIAVVKELIALYPKDQYVLTLAGVYSELGDTTRQLALTETLYDSGRLKDAAQLVNLANLHLLHNVPYKAAQVLERGMQDGLIKTDERNLRLLSQAWYQAREDERAIPPLQQAANMSSDGELFVRLAQSYLNLDRWEEAVSAVEQGLARGGVRRPDTAHLMLGMALFNLRRLEAAEKAFTVAADDKRSSKAARQWLSYLSSELSRNESLNQVVPAAEQRSEDAVLQNL